MKKGKLISISGPDNIGKTTQINELEIYFHNNGIDYSKFKFPSSNNIGGMLLRNILNEYITKIQTVNPERAAVYTDINEIIKKENEREAYHLLFIYDFLYNKYKIEKELSENKFVLCDRYKLDFICYANVEPFGLKKDEIKLLSNLVPNPDISILLIGEPFEPNKYTDINDRNLSLQSKIRKEFENLKSDTSKVIDVTNKSKEDITKEILEVILNTGNKPNSNKGRKRNV